MKWLIVKKTHENEYRMGDYKVARDWSNNGLWGVAKVDELRRVVIAGRFYGKPDHMQPPYRPFKYLRDAKALVVKLIEEESK